MREVAQRCLLVLAQRLIARGQSRQGRQVKTPRDQPQYGCRIVRSVIDEPAARERRDHESRDARSRTNEITLGRCRVIPSTTELIIGDDDYHVFPLRAGLQLRHQVGDVRVAIVELEYSHGQPEQYVLPLSLEGGEKPSSPQGVIAILRRTDGSQAFLMDALFDPAAAARIRVLATRTGTARTPTCSYHRLPITEPFRTCASRSRTHMSGSNLAGGRGK